MEGTTTYQSSPVDVSGLTSGMTFIATGGSGSCAFNTAGGLKCWGYNGNGQLGDGTTTNHSTPVDVSGLTSGVQMVALGSAHTCALLTSGGVKCWGNNSSGQLGDGTTAQRLTPVDVYGLTSNVIAIAAGDNYTCAVLSGGAAKCWGDNTFGQL